MMRTEKEKMIAGDLYDAADSELQIDRAANKCWLDRYNNALNATEDDLRAMLRLHLAQVGERVVIRPPFHCDYGYNIRIGEAAFLNFNCILLDVAAITIGDGAQIGPAVQIYSADHPRDPDQRRRGLESGRPVHIGRNVWIGGGAIVLPGVTVGDDAIIGAGAVVTRDVPAGMTVAGNPARPISR